jgi:hypothetical protein
LPRNFRFERKTDQALSNAARAASKSVAVPFVPSPGLLPG